MPEVTSLKTMAERDSHPLFCPLFQGFKLKCLRDWKSRKTSASETPRTASHAECGGRDPAFLLPNAAQSQPCSGEGEAQSKRLCFLRGTWRVWALASGTLGCQCQLYILLTITSPSLSFLIRNVEIIRERTPQKLCAHGMKCRGKSLAQGSGSAKRGPSAGARTS